ncbi:hypothetical protein [Nakamurella endophytica]|uniref:Uncharacterized protein n=1 Tax=Nakamurella endophytica TaxID=1748367 RepID=A0A917WJ96_9ACTN|nr:hypothetical protein [Nakamurella endophytica]GGM08020.1 hypothetical protein GCM10011594_29960 [Nakamurella endophytica]
MLLAVLAGLFGMHVLTAEDSAGGHGALLPAGASGTSDRVHAVQSTHATTERPTGDATAMMITVDDQVDAMTAEVAPPAVNDPAHGPATAPKPADSPTDHGDLAGCVLFLVTGTALTLALLLSGRLWRDPAARLAALTSWGPVRRRGPPGQNRPREALCVIRV